MSNQLAEAIEALKEAKDLETQIESNIHDLLSAHERLSKKPGWRRMEFPGEVEDVKDVLSGITFDHTEYPKFEDFGVLVRKWREAQTRAIRLFEALPQGYRELIKL